MCQTPFFTRPRTTSSGEDGAAAPEAKSDEEGIPGKKPREGDVGKVAVGATKQRKGGKAAASKSPAAEKRPKKRNPAQKKPEAWI